MFIHHKKHHFQGARQFACAAALLTIGVVVVGATLLGGCGAGGTTPQVASVRTAQETGKATFAVAWPARTVDGRLIPFAANSIVVRLTSTDGSKLYGNAILTRPSGGGAASATFDKVPVGQSTLTAMAYPNADGTGTAQASAQAPVTVVQSQTTNVTLTMATTIAKVTVVPATATLTIGNTAALVATATDVNGSVVLISSSTLAWTSSTAAIASVDATGKVTAVKAGAATITARETESGASGSATITVGAAPTPTPNPSPAATISFAAPITYNVPTAADMVAADLDSDGNADIVVSSGGNLVVLWGHGDGTFDAAQTIYTGTGDNPRPRAAVDMNNDGKLDLVCSADSSMAYVLYNTGNRTFGKVVVVPVPGGTKSSDIAVADFDGDGLVDMAVMLERSSGGGSGSIRIVKNNGSGNFTLGTSYTVGSYAEGITTGDINGDGKPDMIGTYINGSGGSTVYLGKGDGTFTIGNSYNTASANIPIPILADFNKDGKIDLGVDDYFDNNMGVLFGNGDGTFQAVATYSAAPYPLVWQAVDLDGDGYPDIVAPNAGTGNFTVLRNQGNGLFSAAMQFNSGGSNTRTSVTADFNKDGRPDLAFGCESSNSVEVLINTSK